MYPPGSQNEDPAAIRKSEYQVYVALYTLIIVKHGCNVISRLSLAMRYYEGLFYLSCQVDLRRRQRIICDLSNGKYILRKRLGQSYVILVENYRSYRVSTKHGPPYLDLVGYDFCARPISVETLLYQTPL